MENMSAFAQTIMEQKYSHTKKSGRKETWPEIAKRVAYNVMESVDAEDSLIKNIDKIIRERKFIPGGRYLYSCGKRYHQTQNCFLFKAEDSREGWSDLMQKTSLTLMTGGGVGIDYSDIREEGALIRKTGGIATGPLALMQMVNEAGRGIMQGGSRRSAIWAGLSWKHPDIHKFINMKNWIPEVRELKLKDFSFPATMDMTNISVLLDDEFFKAYHNEKNKLHPLANSVYWATIKRMLKTGEPGFSIDVGENSGETLRNAPLSGSTYVLTNIGYKRIDKIAGCPIRVWTGERWANTKFVKTRKMDDVITVVLTGRKEITCSKDHPFITENNERINASDLKLGQYIKVANTVVEDGVYNGSAYLLGFIYGDGSFHKKYSRCELSLCGDKENLLGRILDQEIRPISYNYDKRGILRIYYGNNELFRNKTKTILSDDVLNFNYESRIQFLAGYLDADGNDDGGFCRANCSHREFLYGIGRLAESLGFTYLINKGSNGSYKGTPTWTIIIKGDVSKIPCSRLKFNNCAFSRYCVVDIEDSGKEDVYCCDVGVDEHSFQAEGVIVGNCTEVSSYDDSDVCNLGSINLARIESLEEMKNVVELSIAFLIAGTVYSDVPSHKIDLVRTKNRRLGLGIMGLHEWLLINNKSYGPDDELEKYLIEYANSGEYAKKYAKQWKLSIPKKTRAIAPTGSIGIIGETSTGIEPIFCVAYKRRYLKHKIWHYQYVIDPTAKRLIENHGVNPDSIEDAFSLANDVERRVAFQSWVQKYVDHGISSTINLPAWGSELNNKDRLLQFGNMIIDYLPKLRGLTVYPDGARGGQPLTPIKYNTAIKHVGDVFVEQTNVCDITKGGSCGE